MQPNADMVPLLLQPTAIETIIAGAKLGSARKAAQIDSCVPFAVALFDLAQQLGLRPQLVSAAYYYVGKSTPEWYHACVQIGETLFDSLGRFDHDITRQRMRTHKNVRTQLKLQPDRRDLEEEDTAFHRLCLVKLQHAATAYMAELAAMPTGLAVDMPIA